MKFYLSGEQERPDVPKDGGGDGGLLRLKEGDEVGGAQEGQDDEQGPGGLPVLVVAFVARVRAKLADHDLKNEDPKSFRKSPLEIFDAAENPRLFIFILADNGKSARASGVS